MSRLHVRWQIPIYLSLVLTLVLAGPVLATSGVCDNFYSETLNPGWTWVNPSGIGSYSLTWNRQALTVHLPPGSYAGFPCGGDPSDAPRMLQPVTGDFVAFTKVAVQAIWALDPTAGIVAWGNDAHFVKVEVGEWPRRISSSSCLGGIPSSTDSGQYRYNSAFLRMRRSGNVFSTAYSLNGIDWHSIGSTTWNNAPATIQVGLFATSQGAGINAVFDFFEINDCPELIGVPGGRFVEAKVYPPVAAPKAAFPVTWIVRGGIITNETYLAWDTSSRDYRNDYAHRTATQTGGMDAFTAILEMPPDAKAIYFKPYAVINGSPVWGPREYVVPVTYALNVGAARFGLDASRQYWNPDREGDFSPVWYEFWGDNKLEIGRPIAGTEDDWIYQSQRQGMSRFLAWLGPNVYETTLQVELHLAELEGKAPGQRVFDVYLERGTPNEVVLHGIDVAALAGMDTAKVLTTTVTVNSIPGEDEHLNIEFVADEGHVPILNGLVLRGVSAVPQFLVTRRPGTSADITYTSPTGPVTGSIIMVGGNGGYHGGARFPALQIPQNAVVRYAWFDVTAVSDSSGGFLQTIIRIHAHAADSSPSFESQAVVTSRPRTTAFSSWNMGPLRTNRGYRSPELKDVVQEVLSRPGWRQGNAVTLLLIAESGDRIHRIGGPNLTVWYSRGSDVPPPTSTPTATATHTVAPPPTATPTPTWTTVPVATATPTVTIPPGVTPTPSPSIQLALPLVMRP
jgi:hypothetical protein